MGGAASVQKSGTADPSEFASYRDDFNKVCVGCRTHRVLVLHHI